MTYGIVVTRYHCLCGTRRVKPFPIKNLRMAYYMQWRMKFALDLDLIVLMLRVAMDKLRLFPHQVIVG